MVFSLQAIEETIKNIHIGSGVDDATVTQKITDAVAPVIAENAAQATQIEELQIALTDAVNKLAGGNQAAAGSQTTEGATSGDTVIS